MILEENLYHGAGIIRYLSVCFIKKNANVIFVHVMSRLGLSFYSFLGDESLSVVCMYRTSVLVFLESKKIVVLIMYFFNSVSSLKH